MMYEVELRTVVREIYYVEAESADEAKDNWHNGELVDSKTQYVDEVYPAILVEEGWELTMSSNSETLRIGDFVVHKVDTTFHGLVGLNGARQLIVRGPLGQEYTELMNWRKATEEDI